MRDLLDLDVEPIGVKNMQVITPHEKRTKIKHIEHSKDDIGTKILDTETEMIDTRRLALAE